MQQSPNASNHTVNGASRLPERLSKLFNGHVLPIAHLQESAISDGQFLHAIVQRLSPKIEQISLVDHLKRQQLQDFVIEPQPVSR
jgi:hypothetical protein